MERRDAHLTRGRGQTHSTTNALLPTGVRESGCSGRAGSTAGAVCWGRHRLGSRQRSGALMRGNLGHQRAEMGTIKEKRSRARRSRDVGNQGAEIWGIKEQTWIIKEQRSRVWRRRGLGNQGVTTQGINWNCCRTSRREDLRH